MPGEHEPIADHRQNFLEQFLVAEAAQPITTAASICITREQMNERGACAAKLSANDLDELRQASAGIGSSVVGYPEDCAVLPFGDASLLMTVDFGPVIGIDMVKAGIIAANNAISDIYACGGEPKWAQAVMVVDEARGLNVASHLNRGLAEGCRRNDVRFDGGHTIVGPEAVVGLTVIGTVPPGNLLSKRGAHAGDILLLSKPLGVGLIVRAYKFGLLEQDELDHAVRVMLTSNRAAARAAVTAGVRAMTDCTGFGLAGTVCEMLMGEPLGAVLRLGAMPVLPAVLRIPEAAARTRYVAANAEYVRRHRQVTGVKDFRRLAPLFAPETSGGLVCAAPAGSAAELTLSGLFQPIGEVTESGAVEFVE